MPQRANHSTVQSEEALAAKFAALLPHLDERQRRLLMGAEARFLGHGGIKLVTRAAGVSAVTVSRGIDELEAGGEPLGRIRKPGGGRKPVTQTDPGVSTALLGLVELGSRGDPQSPLRWTTKSMRRLQSELAAVGHPVSVSTVAKLLKAEGFTLQGNAKTIEGAAHPDRDAQFRYLNDQATDHLGTGDPVISIYTKKEELVGEFKNAGGNGFRAAKRSGSTCTTSWTSSRARPSRTASATRPPTRDGSASAPTATPPSSRSPPSPPGGVRPDHRPTRMRRGC